MNAASSSPLPAPPFSGRIFDVLSLRLHHRETYQIPQGTFGLGFVLAGKAQLQLSHHAVDVSPRSCLRAPEGTLWTAEDQKLDAILVQLSISALRQELAALRPGLHPDVREAIFEAPTQIVSGPLTPVDKDWVRSVASAPNRGVAADLFLQGKVQELIALHLFPSGPPEQEFFCSKQRRLTESRVNKVKWLLGQRIDKPLDLALLAQEVGCSRSYLCRTFSAETGITISQYLRAIRMDRAAKLLRSGNYNVSEAALEVGYQSLSHFSKAFQQEKGYAPSRCHASS